MRSTISTLAMVVCCFVSASCGGEADLESDTASASVSSGEVVDMSAIPDNLEDTIATAIETMSQEDVFVVDVRTDDEWNELHATGAIHWGLVEHLENDEFPDIDKDAKIYVYCRSGNRSGQAIKLMQEAGFTDLVNIAGLDDWVAAEGPTSTGVDGDDQ